ncbi:uncharacterized protein LOC126895223 [Daktulosphaira vitifoliae]|uniref:uncharacterized protein LOC126895223 n=1 Tax=Daktulosphaira vitifoliae TaxID=58002 RepID=UPI0021AA5096|nr:uncharacterized protein LOC126895223 [Daktulosphaira vitifoliae]
MTDKKKRTQPMSLQQKESLVDFVKSHTDLERGKFNDSFSSKHAQSLWEECSLILNNQNGSTKDWQGCRRAWSDIKTNIKKKQSAVNREQRLTGGGSIKAKHCLKKKLV